MNENKRTKFCFQLLVQFPLKETWGVTGTWAWHPKVSLVEEKPGKMKLMTRDASSQLSKSQSASEFSSLGWEQGELKKPRQHHTSMYGEGGFVF